MTNFKVHLPTYRNALYLNNSAIQFLVHANFQECFLAMKGAIQLMGWVCRIDEGGGLSDDQPYQNSLIDIERATQQLSRLDLTKTNTRSSLPLQIVSLSDLLELGVEELSHGLLVRMEETDTVYDLPLLASVMLMNYALAHMITSQMTTGFRILEEETLRVLNFSLTALDIRHKLLGSQPMEIDEHHIPVAISIVSTMISLQRQTRTMACLEVSLMQLERLRLAVNQWELLTAKSAAGAA